jgi:xanthine dehydrogenase FAD-binding subunit
MIANDIVFLQPDTIDEAVAAWRDANAAGLRARYFAGGTELVTGARERAGEFDVAIDVKRIPELALFDPAAGRYGAGVRLSALAGRREAPLVAGAAGGIADRTARNSITLGGNICGRLPYREAVLPFLLFDALATVAGPEGVRTEPISALFDKRLVLAPGELLVGFTLPDPAAAQTAGVYVRRTREARVDYPLVTLCAARVDGAVRSAVGGAFGYPVRSPEAEAVMNRGGTATAVGDRALVAGATADAIPHRYWTDFRASADYRRALLVLALEDALVQVDDT